MARRAHRSHDGAGTWPGVRPLFTWLGRRGGFVLPLPANDNRAPAFHRVRRLASPSAAFEALKALVTRRR